MQIEEGDLFGLLSDTLRNDSRAYSPRKGMSEWDSDVCLELAAKGWESQAFVTVDGDSFGPLVRGVRLRKKGDEEWKLFTYG